MNRQLNLLPRDPTDDLRVALSIRQSDRARQMILQVVPPRTIEVVVPRRIPAAAVESFVEGHRQWIAAAERELLAAFPAVERRPVRIDLPAVGESIGVDYVPAAASRGRCRISAGRLTVPAAAGSDAAPLLRRWLLEKGRRHLKPWLDREAVRTGLMPARVQVRLQKTCWGSCSSSGTISLNAAALLIEPELVRYLLVHELCHLRHLSHSKSYWRLVARHEPAFRRLDRALGAAWRRMPAWLLADR